MWYFLIISWLFIVYKVIMWWLDYKIKQNQRKIEEYSRYKIYITVMKSKDIKHCNELSILIQKAAKKQTKYIFN